MSSIYVICDVDEAIKPSHVYRVMMGEGGWDRFLFFRGLYAKATPMKENINYSLRLNPLSLTSTGKVLPGMVIAGQPWKYLVKRSALRVTERRISSEKAWSTAEWNKTYGGMGRAAIG